jgi:hypothetical protein
MPVIEKLSQLWRRLLFYARRDRFDRELEEEMRFHLEMKAEENLAAGISPEEAWYAAQRQFGNQTLLLEVSRDMWGFRTIETLFQDLRFGIRIFLKSPGLTAVLIGAIALGIGFNSALFSVVNTLLLNPLPFPDADRLTIAWTRSAKISNTRLGVTTDEFAGRMSRREFKQGASRQTSFRSLGSSLRSAATFYPKRMNSRAGAS